MKEAMWSVDPVEGTRYFSHTETGQEALFKPIVDTRPLLKELRSAFDGRWFTVAEAAAVTLRRTDFLPSRHLKRMTLLPADQRGLSRSRDQAVVAGTFTDDVKLRFA